MPALSGIGAPAGDGGGDAGVQAAASRRCRARVAIAAAVLIGHIAVLVGLIAAFAPDLGRSVAAAGLAAVSFTAPPPPPPPKPPHAHAPVRPIAPRARPAGGAAAPRAEAASVVAPSPAIPLAPPLVVAAPVAGAGDAAGAGGAEMGSGAGGAGAGGGGAGYGGSGGGHGADAVKIGGGIDLVRDFDPATRALRLGDYVVIVLSVGPDGVPTGCRVDRPSRDAAANATTCRLALARFRFRPAIDAQGRPVAGTYGWKQVWRR